ncbi:MAG: methionine/alanine import family NSS transporter small subunit [Beutenbergiaceae bacterium]
MTPTAIAMMAIAMLVIWGGLAAAIINLARSSRTTNHSSLRRDL